MGVDQLLIHIDGVRGGVAQALQAIDFGQMRDKPA